MLVFNTIQATTCPLHKKPAHHQPINTYPQGSHTPTDPHSDTGDNANVSNYITLNTKPRRIQ